MRGAGGSSPHLVGGVAWRLLQRRSCSRRLRTGAGDNHVDGEARQGSIGLECSASVSLKAW